MKILIISGAFYPENSPRSFRTTELVKEFCRQGDDVSLMTYYREEHKEFSKNHGFKVVNLGKKKIINFKFGSTQVGVLISRILTRLLLQFFEYPSIYLMFDVKKSLKKIPSNSFDLLISIAVPHPTHWGVAWSHREGHKVAKRWIADCGDPYMGDKTDSFKKFFYFKYFEKSWCKLVDVITVPFEGAKSGYYDEFKNKIKIVPQGFNFEETKAMTDVYVKNEIPTFIYAGIFIPGLRDPRPIISHLISLKKEFKFKIYTSNPEYIRDLVIKSSGRIEIHNFIPRESLIKELSTSDFVINIENSGIKENLPSKLIDYYLSGRPILSIDCNNINFKNINEFLDGNYTAQLKIEDIEKHNIINIVDNLKQFANCE